MRRTFVESSSFSRRVEQISPELLEAIQKTILERPGDVVAGTGGIRKIRVAWLAKGKSGGFRVLYLDVPSRGRIYLLGLYGKSQKVDISEAEKKILRRQVEELKRELE